MTSLPGWVSKRSGVASSTGSPSMHRAIGAVGVVVGLVVLPGEHDV